MKLNGVNGQNLTIDLKIFLQTLIWNIKMMGGSAGVIGLEQIELQPKYNMRISFSSKKPENLPDR